MGLTSTAGGTPKVGESAGYRTIVNVIGNWSSGPGPWRVQHMLWADNPDYARALDLISRIDATLDKPAPEPVDVIQIAIDNISECTKIIAAERDTLRTRVADLEEACAMKDRIIRNLHPEASGLRARLETLETRLEATRKGYGYLQDRLESIGYAGWAHDMDGEINSTY